MGVKFDVSLEGKKRKMRIFEKRMLKKVFGLKCKLAT
jgi:hypothetical protein